MATETTNKGHLCEWCQKFAYPTMRFCSIDCHSDYIASLRNERESGAPDRKGN